MALKRVLQALCAGVIGCVVLSLCGFTGDCERISDQVLRLHILAASDSEEDQALKLKVRDAILAQTGDWFDGVQSRDEAEERVRDLLPTICRVAEQTLAQNGAAQEVSAALCDMSFTTREYENVTLPAGRYRALRVTIGEGKGQNWWCVCFPPLCVSSACEQELSDVLGDDGAQIVTQPERYEVRFKLVEWYVRLREWAGA